MPNVDWGYLRKNCESCSKASGFFAEHGIEVTSQVDARTTPLVDADALRLVTLRPGELYVTRGTKVVHFDLNQTRPDDESLLADSDWPQREVASTSLEGWPHADRRV